VQWIGLEIRAGLHAGEFELTGHGKPSGIGMSIGARIASLAGPGEIWVSDTVRQLLVGSDYSFEARGTHALRGVPGEWAVHVVEAAEL
jgi:class 3 adenylate cyclase